MSSIITNTASSDTSGDLLIVQNYKAQLQALGYSPGRTGKCIRTVVHLITWLTGRKALTGIFSSMPWALA